MTRSVQEFPKEFMRLSGTHKDTAKLLYGRLIDEEYKEWSDATMYENTEEELKELADLAYVVYGYAESRGWNLDEALRRVHENNVGRMFHECSSCGPYTQETCKTCNGTGKEIKRREDGKIIKNPDYPKVNLKDLV